MSKASMERFIKIIKKEDLGEGDLLIIDPERTGLTQQNMIQLARNGMFNKVSVLFVRDINAVKFIKLTGENGGH
jgi:hypothetical protein